MAQLTASLSCYTSGLNRPTTSPEEHNTHAVTTITLNGTTSRRHSNTSPSSNEQIPNQLLRSSATNKHTNKLFVQHTLK